jgi:putrescine transport system substrate-binding protein
MNEALMRIGGPLLGLLALAGCGAHHDEAVTTAAGAAEEKLLNVYSWLDYIAPDTVANFEKETGIKVHYDMYDNNEVLETKLLTGNTHYDIVLPTGYFFARQRSAGIFRKLDKAALSNLHNADPEILRMMAVYDPGNDYAIPYMFATTGLGYNVAQVQARLGGNVPDGWSLLFDANNAAKLKDCGIAIVDSEMDVFESAMLYLGKDPNRLDAADVAAASAVLMKIRPFVRYIDPAQYISDMANGSICLSLGWSGDVEQANSRAAEANTGVKLAYFVPREGAAITVDMMAIPADAPHPHNAALWMNYLMRPEVMASITNFIRYPNGYSGSLPGVLDSVKSDAAIYPAEAVRTRLFVPKAVPLDYTRVITREWTRFRTGN